jgi:hypothetical protein
VITYLRAVFVFVRNCVCNDNSQAKQKKNLTALKKSWPGQVHLKERGNASKRQAISSNVRFGEVH